MKRLIFKSQPLFDSIAYIEEASSNSNLLPEQAADYSISKKFLASYKGSQGTFNSYRREVERLLHWTWTIKGSHLKELRKEDLENFIRFCNQPPLDWIGLKKLPRFIEKEGKRIPNEHWRPFVTTISKSSHRKGNRPTPELFSLSQGAIKEIFAILSSYFNFLVQEEYVYHNPIALIRQKSKFIRKDQTEFQIRRLSDKQWQTVIDMANRMAEQSPAIHERTLFIMSCLYSMYLRISELAASERWIPQMNHFFRDSNNNWWFTTVGKGNKKRDIAVSDAMLMALKRWRTFLGLSPLPTPADNSPLIVKNKGKGPLNSINQIRIIVQKCFDHAIEQLKNEKLVEEAESLLEATVHWLRHTGISDDVKHRPREHVRDDAGHSSSAITDKYIDIELRERHRSAKNKPII